MKNKKRKEWPNDPKLSDGREKPSITRTRQTPVRCSAWLGDMVNLPVAIVITVALVGLIKVLQFLRVLE